MAASPFHLFIWSIQHVIYIFLETLCFASSIFLSFPTFWFLSIKALMLHNSKIITNCQKKLDFYSRIRICVFFSIAAQSIGQQTWVHLYSFFFSPSSSMNIYNIHNQIVIMLPWKLKLKDSNSNHKSFTQKKKKNLWVSNETSNRSIEISLPKIWENAICVSTFTYVHSPLIN